MSRANILVSLALSLMSHGAAAEQISAPDLAAIQKAVEAGDGAALVPLLKGKTVTMEAAERDATRLVLLEHLALVAADSTAERSAVGQALLAIAPEDKIGKALAIAEPPAGAPTAEAPLPKEFSLALEKNDGKDLVRLVLSPTLKLSDLHSRAAEIEKAIAEYARPLPASNATDNKEAYRALAKLVPDNATYAEKSQSYAALEAERNESILRKLKKKPTSSMVSAFMSILPSQDTPTHEPISCPILERAMGGSGCALSYIIQRKAGSSSKRFLSTLMG
ncbi:MAG: hypothetical protein Q4615_10145 [Paracoccus aminovorans]|nr:hypothetical protein [Paracoccus aminovorans]